MADEPRTPAPAENPQAPEATEAPAPEIDPDRSGLGDPARAARSLAALALAFEALALLMGIVPMWILLDDPTPALIAIGVLVTTCIVMAGMSKRPWIWKAGAAVQVALIACWPIHWSLGVAGLAFAAVWAYCWYVKHQLLNPPKR